MYWYKKCLDFEDSYEGFVIGMSKKLQFILSKTEILNLL